MDEGDDPFARLLGQLSEQANPTSGSGPDALSAGEPSRKRVKSARRREKDAAWRARSTQRERTAEAVRARCKFFNEGRCVRGAECPYSHDFVPEKLAVVCRDFVGGHCKAGDACSLSHRVPCRFFHVSNTCSAGVFCRFHHDRLSEADRVELQFSRPG